MAQVVAVIASTHHPFYYRASTSTGEDRPPFADEWVAKIEAFRQTLTRAEPDVLVMVGSDHFHQLWLDNMPQFLIGKAPFYDANYYNEEREFGLPRMFVQGQEDLSAYLLREGLLDAAGLEHALEQGWYVSFAGNVTYRNASDLRAAAAPDGPLRPGRDAAEEADVQEGEGRVPLAARAREGRVGAHGGL